MTLIVDRIERRVTQVLLDKGHAWGQKRSAIAVESVINVKHGVQINLAEDHLRELLPVDLDVQAVARH